MGGESRALQRPARAQAGHRRHQHPPQAWEQAGHLEDREQRKFNELPDQGEMTSRLTNVAERMQAMRARVAARGRVGGPLEGPIDARAAPRNTLETDQPQHADAVEVAEALDASGGSTNDGATAAGKPAAVQCVEIRRRSRSPHHGLVQHAARPIRGRQPTPGTAASNACDASHDDEQRSDSEEIRGRATTPGRGLATVRRETRAQLVQRLRGLADDPMRAAATGLGTAAAGARREVATSAPLPNAPAAATSHVGGHRERPPRPPEQPPGSRAELLRTLRGGA